MIWYCKVENEKIQDAKRLAISEFIKTLDGGWAEVSIKKYLGKASDRQRRYWFGVVIPCVIDHCGYDGISAKDDCHDDLMYKLMPELRKKRKTLAGGEIDARVSWTELDREQTTLLIERAFHFAATELGLVIPSPAEYLQ